MGNRGERKKEVEERGEGDEKDRKERNEQQKNRLKTANLRALSRETLIALYLPLHKPLFIYNTCTDCLKLYITDQQAKAAWRASPPQVE